MVSKKVVVTTTKVYEISIDEELLTEEALEGFSQVFYPVSDQDEIFEHVAYNIHNGNVYSPTDFVEGIGEVKVESHEDDKVYSAIWKADPSVNVEYEVED